jgi:hypothetical protein
MVWRLVRPGVAGALKCSAPAADKSRTSARRAAEKRTINAHQVADYNVQYPAPESAPESASCIDCAIFFGRRHKNVK